MFFGIGQQEMTLEEIGDKFGLTRERVRQIKEKQLEDLDKVIVVNCSNLTWDK